MTTRAVCEAERKEVDRARQGLWAGSPASVYSPWIKEKIFPHTMQVAFGLRLE